MSVPGRGLREPGGLGWELGLVRTRPAFVANPLCCAPSCASLRPLVLASQQPLICCSPASLLPPSLMQLHADPRHPGQDARGARGQLGVHPGRLCRQGRPPPQHVRGGWGWEGRDGVGGGMCACVDGCEGEAAGGRMTRARRQREESKAAAPYPAVRLPHLRCTAAPPPPLAATCCTARR